ncbi:MULTISPECIES: hypothetical protein [unclassified Streptomyces]|uniref:hypothetical protein n=1 Tax=unclassified Streptomyces TaxID=2593676 RepID=UPI0021ACF688|nr:hypothetical protein [Streptomyces sp. KhCrAH-43]
MLTAGMSVALAGSKPPDPYPPELKARDTTIGINKQTGEYCDTEDPDERKRRQCRPPLDCEDFPAEELTVCIGEGSSDPDDAHTFELNELKRWKQKTSGKDINNYEKIVAYLDKCVKEKKGTFADCKREASDKYSPSFKSPLDWVSGQISKMASSALKEAASTLGQSVVWLLKQFANAFNSISTINLSKTGIGPVMGVMTGLSLVVAAFLLLVQFGKLAVSQQGGPLVTAGVGLAKWGVITGVYLMATQTALKWSDTLSTALINFSFAGGGSGSGDASKAMEQQLGTLFASLVGGGGGAAVTGAVLTGSAITSSAIGFVIVISILCILAIAALWIEMLVRQAGIMILVVMMPLALAGQMSDATKDWWPKARNALIALILMKPTIVIVFSIGFSAMSGAKGVQNVIVGLIIFVVAATSWPVLAKFIVISPNGDGNSAASGMISSIGSSVGGMFGGNQPAMSGAGTSGGGAAYTKALEGENSSSADGDGGGRGFWSKTMAGVKDGRAIKGAVGVGLQLAAVGKDMAESSLQNAAAHAGLGHGAQGGRHTVIPPRSGTEGEPGTPEPAPQPASQETAPPATRETEPPPVQRQESPPSPAPTPPTSPSEGS